MILINEWNIMRPNGNHNKGIETDRTKLINFKFTCQQNGKRKKKKLYIIQIALIKLNLQK